MRSRCLAVSALLLAVPGAASAQAWPQKPVRMVVPWPAGGGVDTTARIIGQKLGEALGQTVIIDNRVGATGTIGADFVAKAPPDGYTLIATSPPLIMTPSLLAKLPYDPLTAFAPVTNIVAMPFYFIAHPSVPAKGVQELLALARAQPGKVTFASSGSGSGSHLIGELLRQYAKVDLLHVPYKGTAPALSDTVGGQTALMFSDPSAIPMIKGGRLRALAVTSATRHAVMPDVPTMAEQGLKEIEVINWYPLLAPAGTPRDIVQRLNAEVGRIVATPDVRDRMLAQGLDPAPSTPEALGATMRGEHARWARVIKAGNIRYE